MVETGEYRAKEGKRWWVGYHGWLRDTVLMIMAEEMKILEGQLTELTISKKK